MSAIPETAVIAKLKATSAVTALVSTRIYPRIAPQDASMPYIVVTRPSGETRPQRANKPTTFCVTPMSVFCVAETYQASRDVSTQAVLSLQPNTANTGSATWGAVAVDHCTVLGTHDGSGNPQLADEIGFPVEIVEIDLFHLTA